MRDNLNGLIELIIKYADEIDIGQFLINVHEDLIDRIPGDDKFFSDTNREYFIEHLYDDNPYKKLLFFHLKMLAKSFYTNEVGNEEQILKYEESLKCDEDSDMEVSPNKLGIRCLYKGRENIITFEELTKCTKMKRGDFREIFNCIVNCYRDTNFYYWITDKYIIKMLNVGTNEKPEFKRIKYQLYNTKVKSRRTTCIKDINTGMTYDLGEVVQGNTGYWGFCIPRGAKLCKNLHKRIINSLKGIQNCSLCNPSCSDTNEPCKKCQKLLKQLKYFENLDNENEIFKISNIQSELYKINTNNCINIAEVRAKRKLFLKQKVKYIIKEVDYGYGYKYKDEELKKRRKIINQLIDESFAEFIKF